MPMRSTRMQRHRQLARLAVAAIAAALLLFGVFVWFAGVSPVEVWLLLFKGAFGDWFSWQNTLQRAAPLMLTALCVAIPARAGLVIIGGEGALVLGGLACAALAYGLPLPGNIVGTVLVCLAGALAGALWIALAGWLRQYRGINETISSLLLAYVAIGLFKHLVEGAAARPGQPEQALDAMRWPKACASAASAAPTCTGAWCSASSPASASALWLRWTPSGFSVRVVGGNPRTAQLVGLPAIAPDPAGLRARRRLRRAGRRGRSGGRAHQRQRLADRGLRLRRHPGVLHRAPQPAGRSIPVAILFGGFGAAGSLLQRRLGLPDASVLVLQGIAFVLILASEALRDVDWKALWSRGWRDSAPARAAAAAVPRRSATGDTTHDRRPARSSSSPASSAARCASARPSCS